MAAKRTKYVVRVTQVTTFEVESTLEAKALEEAYASYMHHDADSVDAKVLSATPIDEP